MPTGKLILIGVLLLHLLFDQITDGGRTRGFCSLATYVFQSLLVVFNVFGLDRQVDYAVLAIDADDLRFNFFAFFQNVTRVFNAVTADFRSLQYRLNFLVQGNGSAFGVYCRNSTLNDGALVVQLNELGERIAFQLLDTQEMRSRSGSTDRITVSTSSPFLYSRTASSPVSFQLMSDR